LAVLGVTITSGFLHVPQFGALSSAAVMKVAHIEYAG
jgi:hypothetical protein